MSIRDASTVMVLRDSDNGIEVFMVKRNSKMAFMANAFVYPGGKLDQDDMGTEAARHITGRSPAECSDILRTKEDRAVGLYLAAIRETFEEAGFLLARRRGHHDWVRLKGPREPEFQNFRERLHSGDLALAQLAEDEDLVFPLERLGFFAHWITPTFETRRFDTRFFVARAPTQQTPLHDTHENTQSLWVKPAQALDRYRSERDFFLAPPTERTLEQLAAFETIDEVFKFIQGRTPPRIIPHLDSSKDKPVLLLPGDPSFPDLPEYEEAESVDDDVTRMTLSF